MPWAPLLNRCRPRFFLLAPSGTGTGSGSVHLCSRQYASSRLSIPVRCPSMCDRPRGKIADRVAVDQKFRLRGHAPEPRELRTFFLVQSGRCGRPGRIVEAYCERTLHATMSRTGPHGQPRLACRERCVQRRAEDRIVRSGSPNDTRPMGTSSVRDHGHSMRTPRDCITVEDAPLPHRIGSAPIKRRLHCTHHVTDSPNHSLIKTGNSCY
jgi:hypothetical protein